MKKILILFTCIFIFNSFSNCQIIKNNEIIQEDSIITATKTINSYNRKIQYTNKLYLNKRKLTKQRTGFKIQSAYFHTFFNNKTSIYLSDNAGLQYDFEFCFKNLNFGIKQKMGTSLISKKTFFILQNEVPIDSYFFISSTDYYLSVTKNLFPLLSIDPYISLTHFKSEIKANNNNQISFYIPDIYGFSFGTSINKYFKVGKYFSFLDLSTTIEYNLINYYKINPNFGKNSFLFIVGLGFKGWGVIEQFTN